MGLPQRLFRRPPRVVGGEVATGWLGLVTAWGALGFGATAAARAGGVLVSADAGACGEQSATVCQVAGWSGLLMGVGVLAVGVLLGLVVARGFGPPTTWWALPVGLGALALAPFQTAPDVSVGLGWLVVAALAALGAIGLAVAALAQGSAALFGWVRLDGLVAGDVGVRAVDRLVAPVAVAAAVAGGLAAVQVVRVLAAG